MLIEFGSALRKARSLICLHLSGNPGILTDMHGKEDTQEMNDIEEFLEENKIV